MQCTKFIFILRKSFAVPWNLINYKEESTTITSLDYKHFISHTLAIANLFCKTEESNYVQNIFHILQTNGFPSSTLGN